MTMIYALLIGAGLGTLAFGLLGLVAAVAELVRPLPPAIPLVPFWAPEDEQPTLGVRVEVAQKAVAEARERALAAAVVPARGSVRVLDPSRAGWLFAERVPGWSR